jgi:hypothetical protein
VLGGQRPGGGGDEPPKGPRVTEHLMRISPGADGVETPVVLSKHRGFLCLCKFCGDRQGGSGLPANRAQLQPRVRSKVLGAPLAHGDLPWCEGQSV